MLVLKNPEGARHLLLPPDFPVPRMPHEPPLRPRGTEHEDSISHASLANPVEAPLPTLGH